MICLLKTCLSEVQNVRNRDIIVTIRVFFGVVRNDPLLGHYAFFTGDVDCFVKFIGQRAYVTIVLRCERTGNRRDFFSWSIGYFDIWYSTILALRPRTLVVATPSLCSAVQTLSSRTSVVSASCTLLF